MICFSLFLFSGCGIYSFSGSSLPPHIKTVSIPLFEDQTSEFGLDQQITDELIMVVTQDNTLKIAGLRGADSFIKGEITQVLDRAGQYDEQENASDFRIYITVTVSFEDAKKRKLMWEETWTHWGAYSGDRQEGMLEAVGKITQDILNRTVSGW